MRHLLASVITLLLLFAFPTALYAQTGEPTPPPTNPIPQVHTVQAGENPTIIATNYGVELADLMAVNHLSEDSLLAIGQTLIIPGGVGELVATTYTIQPSDTLATVAARFNTSSDELLTTNRLIHPSVTLNAGQRLTVLSRTGSAQPQLVTGTPYLVAPGETLLEIAARHQLSPVALAAINNLDFPAYLFPQQRLRIPNGAATYKYLPDGWVDVTIRPFPITQGSTLSIYVENLRNGRPKGQFAGQPLRFTPQGSGYVALLGIDAFTPPALYSLELTGADEPSWLPFQQAVPVQSGHYATQFLTVGAELELLLDPQVRTDEDAFLAPYYTRYTDQQQWDGLFQMPLTTTIEAAIVTTPYGIGRSYNDGPIDTFHSGIDFAAPLNAPVVAPASGTVIFSGDLTLRGITIIIDHGLGVLSGYYHLAATAVAEGETVIVGQTIGRVGSSGLSTGAHLHWDLRLMNVPVDGFQWLADSFP